MFNKVNISVDILNIAPARSCCSTWRAVAWQSGLSVDTQNTVRLQSAVAAGSAKGVKKKQRGRGRLSVVDSVLDRRVPGVP
jgi:hypothetical protein